MPAHRQPRPCISKIAMFRSTLLEDSTCQYIFAYWGWASKVQISPCLPWARQKCIAACNLSGKAQVMNSIFSTSLLRSIPVPVSWQAWMDLEVWTRHSLLMPALRQQKTRSVSRFLSMLQTSYLFFLKEGKEEKNGKKHVHLVILIYNSTTTRVAEWKYKVVKAKVSCIGISHFFALPKSSLCR